MSKEDKTKLNGIAENANNYVHPTTSGNKHIPSGGSAGQVLKWSSDGTAVWEIDNNTTYNNATTTDAGLMSAEDKTKLDGLNNYDDTNLSSQVSTNTENINTNTSEINAMKLKLNTVEEGATKTIIDTSLNTESDNAISNSAVATAIENISEIGIADLSKIYPVGSIYMSVNNVNPSQLFGGTWEQIKDRFLLSAGDNYEAGEMGGEATHKLTTSEMPSHTHTFTGSATSHTHTFTGSSATTSNNGSHTHTISNTIGNISNCAISANSGICLAQNPVTATSTSNGSHTHTVTAKGSNSSTSITPKGTNSSVGSGQAHNNMPPYLTVYMWKRTA